METKSLPQPSGIHDCFNTLHRLASPVICIHFYMFPLNFMSTAFFVLGFCQAATGYAAWVFYQQEQFNVQESDYPNIGTNPKRLVVYFSRIRSIRRRCSRKLFSLRMAMPCSSSPRISRLSPGCMSNIFRAFAGMTICPLSPTFTMPKMCFPLGGTSSPKFSRSVFS